MPCTTTLVFSSTKMAMSVRSVRNGDGRAGGVEHGWSAGEDLRRNAGVEEDLATLLGVGAVQPHHHGGPQRHALEGFDDALGHLFAPGDAAENVDEDDLHGGVGVDDLEGGRH